MKNHPFCQNLRLFEKTIIFRGFDELFGKKLQKVADLVKKSMKYHRFSQNLQVFEEIIVFGGFHKLFGKKLQKVADFVEKHGKSWIWPKLSTFRENHHVWRCS